MVEIQTCRISGSKNLMSVLNLGRQALTGVFPKSTSHPVSVGPLELVWCSDSGLLQLKHSYDLNEMYGENYGYRSGLNESMREHLRRKVANLLKVKPVLAGDVVLDIGSNDGTLLAEYKISGLRRIGIDPSGAKFAHYYASDITLIPDFFSAEALNSIVPRQGISLITSIAMFYDLESPRTFVSDIESILAKDGIWHLEQSYMPSMLRTNAYDTVCHEHIEYYSLSVIKDLIEAFDLRIIDVGMNSVNGGSFAITVARKASKYCANSAVINWLLEQEDRMGLDTPRPYRDFEDRVYRHRNDLRRLIRQLSDDNKKIVGYGASTKGNVLLQFCDMSSRDLQCIAEINVDKFGSFTPGTKIPIVSEQEAKSMNPDYMLVLPWHFRESIMRREAEFLANGGKLIFPLPEIEIV